MVVMLFVIVIGKIIFFYKNVFYIYFENGSILVVMLLNVLGVSLGGYMFMGEEGRWFELEILVCEL